MMERNEQLSDRRSPHLSNIIPRLWSLLEEHEKEQLLIWSSFYIYKKGEIIFEAKSIPQNAYILASGQVKITQGDDRDQIMRLVRAVEFFGYYAHFASSPMPSTATAVDESLVCLIPIHSLELILNSNPKVGVYFMQELSQRLLESNKMTITLTQKHTRGRLASSLLLIKKKFGEEMDGTIRAYLSRNELANLSNMTMSNAVRTLRSFHDEGVIELEGKKIKIKNEEKLIRISDLG